MMNHLMMIVIVLLLLISLNLDNIKNYFNKEDVLIVRLKRDNIDIDKDRANRNLNQVIPDSCQNINIVENNMNIHHACLDIISLCSKKWPDFYNNL